MSTMHQLSNYRKKHELMYNLRQKYSDLLEFDKIKRSASRICNFAKKKILYTPYNSSKNEIGNIPGIYRFRCYIYDIDEFNEINKHKSIKYDALKKEKHTKEETDMIKKTIKNYVYMRQKELLDSDMEYIKYPILLDLREFTYIQDDILSDVTVYFCDKLYTLDEMTLERMREQCDKINNPLRKEKFLQIINHSKALCKTYANDLLCNIYIDGVLLKKELS